MSPSPHFVPPDRPPPNGPASARRPSEARSGEGSSNEAARILVVDDDEAICEMLRLVLSDEGYDVVTAGHGMKALAVIRDAGAPDLVILDLMMPVMSGWDVWDELQASPQLSDIPVIVFTATGLRQGAVGRATVLSKTTDADVLLVTISDLLKRG